MSGSRKVSLCCILLPLGVFVAISNALTYDKSENRLHANNGQAIGNNANSLREFLQLPNEGEINKKSSSSPIRGKTVSRYDLTHNGLKIRNGRVTVCSDDNTELVTDVDGIVVHGLETDPKISPVAIEQAKSKQNYFQDLAKKATKETLVKEDIMFESVENELFVDIFKNETGFDTRLLYEIGLYSSQDEVIAQKILISVDDEQIIGMYNNLQNYAPEESYRKISSLGGNPRHFYTYDGIDYEQINVSYIGKTDKYTHACDLNFTDYAIVHCQNQDGYSKVFGTPFTFNCDPKRSKRVRVARSDCTSIFRDETNGACSPLADIAYFAPKALQMYREYLNSPYSNPLGKKINICVHYKQNYFNAFFLSKTYGLYFGDGINGMYPLSTSALVFGHELGHMRSYLVAHLIYANETGGLSESISDITGLTFDYFINEGKNKTTLNWLVGDDVLRVGDGFRDLCNPDISTVAEYLELEPMPGSNNKSPYKACGIFNKLACELVHRHQNSYNLQKVFVLFDTGLLFWNSQMSFDEISCGFLRAANFLEYDLVSLKEELNNRGMAIDQCDIL